MIRTATFVFLTGAAGLVYQIAWQRYLARLLGSDTLATAAVLGVFLGGLSLGYLVAGRLTLRARNPLALYGALEALIGVWGLAFPVLFRGLESVSTTWAVSDPLARSVQGLLFAAILIGPPTLAMGGTVPILTRALTPSVDLATAIQSRIYAVNTGGAFVGALASGFVLVPWMGLPGTVRLAAALNLLAAGYFLWTSRRPLSQQHGPEAREGARTGGPGRRAVTTIAFLSGAYVMTLESLLIRVTGLSLGSSSYSFALIVAAFVLAIAIGAGQVGRCRRIPPWSLLVTQGVAVIALLAVFATLDSWPYGAHLLRIGFQANELGFALYHLGALVLLLLVLGLPVGLMGATLPLAFHSVKSRLERVGDDTGRLFAANAAGSLAGAIGGGFIAFRWLSIPGVFILTILLVVISILLSATGLRPTRWRAVALGTAIVVSLALLIGWGYEPERFATGTFRLRTAQSFSFDGPESFFAGFGARRRVVAYDDSPEGSFAVVESAAPSGEGLPDFLTEGLSSPAGPSRMILVNGKPDSDTFADRETLKLAAHLPILLNDGRARVLVVGLGTGMTVGEVGLHPEVEAIDVAEISSTVINYLPHFDADTHGIREDPRLTIRHGDAFHILRSSRERWDIIISEPSNPWVTGVDQLFSREFYRLVREHLEEGGALLQWVQRYETSDAISAIAVNTLRGEFPHVRVFRGSAGDDLFLATLAPVTGEAFDAVDARLQLNPRLQASLDSIGIAGGEGLRVREQADALETADSLRGLGIETLDRPRIHYLSGYAFFTGGSITQGQVIFSF